MQTQDPLNQTDDTEEEKRIFNKKVRSAKIKSAVVAAVPTLIILIDFISAPPFGKHIFPNLMTLFLRMVVPFAVIYQFTFLLGFGKKFLPKLYGKSDPWEPMPYTDMSTDRVIDTLNSARGYGPGRGCLGSPSLTSIDDSHHHRY